MNRFFIRIRLNLRKIFKRFKRDPKQSICFGLICITIVLFIVLSLTTPLIFNVDITFETYDGTDISDITIRKGATLPDDLIVPEKEYNTFGGWYYDKDYQEPYNYEKLKSDTKLYAKWNTIFNSDFFKDKLELLNDVYNKNYKPEDIIKYPEDFSEIKSYGDEIENQILNQNVNLYFSFNDDAELFLIKSLVVESKAHSQNIVEFVENNLPESINSMYNIIIKDVGLFLIPKGLEDLFFGEIKENEDYYYTLNENGTSTLLRYKGADKNVTLPAFFEEKPVTTVGALAFYESYLESVTLPDTVESIGYGAFYRNNITEIILPDNVKRLNAAIFFKCNNLEEIYIPEKLTKFDSGALANITGLKNISISNNNPDYTVRDGVLFSKDMKSLVVYPPNNVRKSYSVPYSVKKINMGAFYNSQKLQNISLPQSLETINAGAFGFSGIKNIAMPKSVKFIEEGAFEGCSELSSVTFEEGSKIKSIPKKTFNNCALLKTVELPDTIETVKQNAFTNCTELTSINLTDNLEKIEREAFMNCKKLNNLYLSENITYIGDESFFFCESLEDIDIPKNINYLGERAFDSCISLTEITVPATVKNVGQAVFSNCESVINFSAPLIVSGINSLSNYFEGNEFPIPLSLETVTINNDIEYLPDKVFFSCRDLKNINIPDSITEIGNSAFDFCTSLTNIDIPDGVIEIGNQAFAGCSSLGRIELPKSLEVIGDFAFSGRHQEVETDIIIEENNNIKEIGSGAFSYNDSITNIVLTDNINYIGENAFQECNNLVTADLSANEHAIIGQGVFNACNNITEMKIPLKEDYNKDTLSYLGYYFGAEDFSNDWIIPNSLTKALVTSDISKLPDNAFYNCDMLETIVINENITEIGEKTFFQCRNLENLNLKTENIERIGKNAFDSCEMLEITGIFNNLEQIGDLAFFNCKNMDEFIVSSTEVEFGQGVLKSCNNITEITVPLKNSYSKDTNSYLLYYFEETGDYNNLYSINNLDNLIDVNIIGDNTKINSHAFYGFEEIETIDIPSTITEIEESAFEKCKSLQSINIPSNIHDIGKNAFRQCESLINMDLPVSILNIKDGAFAECIALKSVNFPENSLPTSIGKEAFYMCSNLTSINIPDNSVYEIKDRTFYGCTNLTSFVFSDNIQYIRESAFENSALTSLSIPRTVIKIGGGAFKDCSDLEEVVFEELHNSRLNEIGIEAFKNCELITEVVFPEKLRSIVGNTFNGCSNLQKVVVLREYNYLAPTWEEMGLVLNGEGSFDNCHEDLTIYVPRNNARVIIDGIPSSEAKNGVTMYKRWMEMEDYADRVEAIPFEWYEDYNYEEPDNVYTE